MTDDTERVIGVVREQGVDYDTNGEAIPWTDVYVKVKVAFRQKALKLLKGPKLSCFLCVALHVGDKGTAHPSIDTIMRETGYSRSIVCNALADLEKLGFIEKQRRKHDSTLYHIRGYVWFGSDSKPTLLGEAQSSKSELSKPQSKGSKRLESESLPDEPKDNPSSKDQPATAKDNLGSDSEKSDSDFPENPVPASPDSIRAYVVVVYDDHYQEIWRTSLEAKDEYEAYDLVKSKAPKHHDWDGWLKVSAPASPDPGGDVDEQAIIDSIADDFLNKPAPEDLQRATAAARAAAGGNYADPATFALADHLITAACARLGRSEPTGRKRDNAVAFFKKALEDEGLLQGDADMLEQAVRDWLDPQGEYAFFLSQYELTTKHELALRHFGIVLSKTKKQVVKPDRRARYARTAELAKESQAAWEKRKAARDPPVEDDTVGKRVKADLERGMGRNEFREYVKPTCFTCDDGTLVVTAPTAFAKDWLENHLGVTIRRALHGFTDGPQEVRFEVGDDASA